MAYTLVATAKNEGPFLLEWIAYHKMIGFDHLIIFQNDSDDFTHQTLAKLKAMGEISYFYNKAPPGRHQIRAYTRAARKDEFQSSDWVMALDLDEFLVVHHGEGRVQDLTAAVPDSDILMINWKRFGSSGFETLSDDLVSERFLLAERDKRVSEMLTPFKAIFKPTHFARCGVHRPQTPLVDADEIRTFNGSGMSFNDVEHLRFRSVDPKVRAFAQINHYMTKDAASFVLKSYKGSAHQSNRPIGQRYWRKWNFNDEEDHRLAQKSPELRARMAELDRASGGVLGALRKDAIALHQQRFKTLMDEEGFRELFEFCQAKVSLPAGFVPRG